MVRNYKRKTEDRWSKQDLLDALTSIKETKLKVNEASQQFGISRATLYRQYHKFQQSGGLYDLNQFRTCGGNPILTRIEEDVLEKTILDLRDQGFSVTSSDIKRICYEYCDSNGIPNQFNTEKRMASDDWYYGFLKRHPNVKTLKTLNGEGESSMSSEGDSRVSDDNNEKEEEEEEEQEEEEEEEEVEIEVKPPPTPKVTSRKKSSSRKTTKKGTKRLKNDKKTRGRGKSGKGKSKGGKGRSRKKNDHS